MMPTSADEGVESQNGEFLNLKKPMQIKVVRLIVGISAEKRFEAVHVCDRYFDGNAYIEFLRKLAHGEDVKPAVFMDNFAYHNSRVLM